MAVRVGRLCKTWRMRLFVAGAVLVLGMTASAVMEVEYNAPGPGNEAARVPAGVSRTARASLIRTSAQDRPLAASAETLSASNQVIALPPGGSFFDDDGNVHEGSIEAIAARGITRGCGVGDLYCPSQPVTRGQMAAFLVRSLNLEPVPGTTFEDTVGSVFAADIEALAAAGITRGCGPGLFCPDRTVTREEMAAFLSRALGLPASMENRFGDSSGSVFAGDIEALAAAGITKGCNPPLNDRFCPGEVVMRDQMASFLARALDLDPIQPPSRPSITAAFSGDVLIHSPVWKKAGGYGSPYDFGPMFDPIAGIVGSADVAICHLEVPLSANNQSLSGYPAFNAPRQTADGLVGAGYDGCSTASNHSFDRGVSGVESTLSVLADVGLAQAGMAATEGQASRATLYQVGEITLAHLSATWWLNGLQLPAAKPWLVQMLDVDELLAQAAAARLGGADVVVVSMHCCAEYQTAPTAYQREVARALVDSPDVDLVVGHHAHVIQPIEERDGEFIIYGLGNFLSAQRFRPETQDGVIVAVEFAPRAGKWVARQVSAHPTWVEGGTFRILPAAQYNPASWRRTELTLTSEGAEVDVIR